MDLGCVHVTECVWSEDGFQEQVWGLDWGCVHVTACVCVVRGCLSGASFGGQTLVVKLAQQVLLPDEPSR